MTATCPRCGCESVAGHCTAPWRHCQEHPLPGCEHVRSTAMLAKDWNLWRAEGRPDVWEPRYPIPRDTGLLADFKQRAAGDV